MWCCDGPEANLGSRRGQHSLGACCILSDCITDEASRGFLSLRECESGFQLNAKVEHIKLDCHLVECESNYKQHESDSQCFVSPSNKFRRPKMSASRVACLINRIPALIKCDLIRLSPLSHVMLSTQTLIIIVERPCPYQQQFIFQQKLTSLTTDCLRIPQNSTDSGIYSSETLIKHTVS